MSISNVLQVRAREQTRGESAAYVAEGTIHKNTAIAMLKAGGDVEDQETA